MDWLDLLASLKSLLQHHSLKALILRHSPFFVVQLSHPYMTTGKTIALTRQIFVGKVMSLLFNALSGMVIAFLLRRKSLLISWLQSPSAVILKPPQNKACHCVHCSMSELNCCFLTCIQIFQEAGQVVWYSHLLKNFLEFVVICTVKGFAVFNKAEVDVFL